MQAALAAAAAWACETANQPSGITRDIVPPTISITTTADTQQIASGLSFSLHATDDLALNDVQLTYTGGYVAQTDTIFKNQTLKDYSQSVAVTTAQLNGAGGLITITARATDGAGNFAVDSLKIFLVNIQALKVTLLQPGVGAVASSGKNIPVSIQATQISGIKRIGYIIVPRTAVTDPTQPPFDSIVNTSPYPDSVVFTDTLTVVATTGTFTVTGFAVDGGDRRAYSNTVTVQVQSAANYTTPPTVSFTVPVRVEVNDSITVHATDPTGIAWIGFRIDTSLTVTPATPPAPPTPPVPLVFDTVNVGAGNLTDVTKEFALGLGAITKFPTTVIVRAYACDLAAARNCGYSTASVLVAGTAPFGGPALAAPGPGGPFDTITVVAGTTYQLPAGGHIADAIYNSNRRELYLTNDALSRVEVFSLATLTFDPNGISTAGPTPWGVALWPVDTLGHYHASQFVVADAGGTELSILDASTKHLLWRQALPNYLIEKYSVVLTPYIHAIITIHDVSDRPQYLGTVCRVTSGTANCAADSIYAVYSTTPTQSSSSPFNGRATLRMEKLINTADTTQMFSHLFWEIGNLGQNAQGDTLRIEMIRPAFFQDRVTLTACRTVTINTATFGLGDQTFTRNSGNFTHAFMGEGGNITTQFARVFAYTTERAITTAADNCSMGGVGGIPESGEDDIDFGMSPGVNVSDFISNTGTHVVAVATNFNGLTNLVRADSIYVLDQGLRLWGTDSVGGSTPGMDMNYNHAFQPGGTCTPTCGGGSGNINDRIVFAASPDTAIRAFDTYFFNQQLRTPIRDPIVGPLRVALDAATNTQYLFAITSRGLVVVTLPSITNTNPQAPPVPQTVVTNRVTPPSPSVPKAAPPKRAARPRALRP